VLDLSIPPGQTTEQVFVIPTGNELDVTDLLLQNEVQSTGSFMQVGVETPGSTTPRYFFELPLATLQAYQITLATPFVLTSGETLVAEMSCTGSGTAVATTPCSGSVYFGGTVQLLGPPPAGSTGTTTTTG
jgi:hypothetical protein